MPNLLFISYSRKQQDKAIELDNIKLNQFYWWMDYRIVGTVDWWKNICEAIEESYCLVALLSKTYTESVFCMGELEYALKLNKPILCFKLEPDVSYPKALEDKQIQYISIDKWNVRDVVQFILEAMVRVEHDYNDKVYHKDVSLRPYLRPPVPVPPTKTDSAEDKLIAKKLDKAEASSSQTLGVDESIIQAIQALNEDNYQRVIDLLEPVRPIAKENNQETIHELLREARLGQEYTKIAALVTAKKQSIHKRGCKQYEEFKKTYPDYSDDKNLSELCLSDIPSVSTASTIKVTTAKAAITPASSISLMPQPFAWIEIPKKGYSIAKYPVTNGQFDVFINADNGYKNAEWWNYSKAAADWRKDNNSAQKTGFTGDEHPRTNVTWFEAVAFCLWLSDATGEKIMLLTEEQWQYAAQGDDGRTYPWGNDWDCQRCNNSVKPCDSNSTSLVRQYEGKGDSPFGVVDMAGNVWEWCLTDYENKTNDYNSDATYRVLRGGSWSYGGTDRFRCDGRNGYDPNGRDRDLGFRCARSY